MRLAAFFLAGIAPLATAAAQNGPAYADFLPIPNRLPAILFAPDPLAGTLLEPFIEPAAVRRDVEIVPVAAAVPTTLAQASPEDLPAAASEPQPLLPEIPPAEGPEAEALAPPEAPPEVPVDTAAPDGAAAPETAAVEEPEPAPPALPVTGTVTVIVENVESEAGVVNVALCDKALSKDGCSYFKEIPAAPGFVETEFDEIPPGTYAVVAYHDVNGNDEFDQFMKIPREPYALSSIAGQKLMPTFEDAALPIHAGDNAVIIRLRRLGG